ncbi:MULTISPECIES: phage tail protein [Photorhabdus]|uniref:phage tail protein n=1 Tax=Photorhabdus TaxID=29487 RepID=UPI000DCF3566|nr:MULTISPECIES: phage tail protein [Photorhabdus]MCT8343461.1 tail fiber protein [Photorhabdus kleinii]RAX03134.1 DNA-packaging protein [Photorhabdus sp. S9-53]RAX03394.1 DNA-packaging protein [Photorhabdus sp. S10-54]RAX05800.1 DNA-packaging protein [Photorhabdus sp. S8-52]
MSHKNDFKAFSISNNANVISQEKYEENQSLQTGFSPENVPTHLLNKVLRQSSTISSVVADFIATQSGNDVLDDGNVAKLTAQLNKAIEQKITTDIPSASLTQKGVVQLTNVIGNSDTLAATQKLVQEVINSLREEINIPVGSPIPWPLPHPPFGYFICNGSPFNKLQYPKLAEAYPGGRLPDLRGEFIRGWDDNRGVDGGRGLLSWQGDAIRNITGSTQVIHAQMGGAPQTPIVYGVMASSRYATADTRSANGGSSTDLTYFDIDASRQVPTANENRPRNVAFNYIVRAA